MTHEDLSRFPNCSTRDFFRGEYVFRSTNGVLAALVLVAFGGLFVWVSSQCFKSDTGRLSVLVGGAFAVGAASFLSASIYVSIALLIGRRDQVIISVDGITDGRRFTPWREISELYGTIYGNGVCIAYTPANRKIYIEKKLPTTPLLRAADYQNLAERIRDGIGHEQSHVRIDIVPRQPVGD